MKADANRWAGADVSCGDGDDTGSGLSKHLLDADVLCWRCRYSLRTRLPSQRCPECDAAIAESIERGREWGELLYRAEWAAYALLLLAVSGAVEVSLSAAVSMAREFFQTPVLYITSHRHLAARVGRGDCRDGVVCVVDATATSGWAGGGMGRVAVIGLRVMRLCVTIVAGGLNAYVFYLGYVRLLMPGHLMLYAGSIGVQMPSIVAEVLIEIIALPYILRLCRAMRSRGAFYATVGMFVVQMSGAAVGFVDDLLRTSYLVGGYSFMGVSWRDLWFFHELLAPWVIAVDAMFAAYVFMFSNRLRRFARR